MQTTQGTEATHLTLLTRDGAIAIEIRPALDSRHYDELHSLVKDFDSEGVARALIQDAAKRWGREVKF